MSRSQTWNNADKSSIMRKTALNDKHALKHHSADKNMDQPGIMAFSCCGFYCGLFIWDRLHLADSVL